MTDVGQKTKMDESRLVELLTKAETAVSESSKLTQLLSNPLVQQVLAAQQAGQQIRIVDQNDDEPDLSNLDDMSRSELLRVINQQNRKAIKNELKGTVEPLFKAVRGILDMQIEAEKQKITTSTKQARKNIKDFAQYEADMLKINQETGITNPNELYTLAKMRAETDDVDPIVETEKPDNSIQGSTTSTISKESGDRKVMKPRLSGFSEFLSDALSTMDIPEVE